MPSLFDLTNAAPQQDAALPVEQPAIAVAPADAPATFADRFNAIQPTADARPEPMPESVGKKIIKRLVGEQESPRDISGPEPLVVGEGATSERYQLWPEKVVREALAAPHDAITGAIPQYAVDPVTGDVHTSPQMIEGAQAVSALAGSGGLAGTTDATLGATPFLRPALKYGDKIYKAPTGGQHLDALPAHLAQDFQTKAMNGEDINHYNFGFMNHKGQFLDREKALDYAVREGLVDPSAGQYGALTSTLLADSSKPGTAIEAMAKTAPKELYHVAGSDYVPGQPLRSLYARKGDAAYDEHAARWPEAGDLSQDHVHKTFFYDNLKEAQDHASDFGGKVLKIDPSKVEGLKLDKLENAGFWATKSDVPPEAIMKPPAPFYSALEHNVNQISQAKMTGDQWLGTLANKPGVKPEEMDWTGVKDFLKENGNKTVSKAELQEHLANNKVELKEVNKAQYDPKKLDDKEYYKNLEEASQHQFGQPYDHLSDSQQQSIRSFALARQDILPTKYHSYQLPGGENYREMLMTLPRFSEAQRYRDMLANKYEKLGGNFVDHSTKQEQDQLYKLMNNPSNTYKSSHWDEPNILAHVRMNDRTIDGKKSLHIEEIQSDWHQQGREQGYKVETKPFKIVEVEGGFKIQKPDGTLEGMNAEGKPYNSRDRAQANINAIENFVPDSTKRGVPDAPFKKTWHELALKRMIREAAEKGYDRLSWTPGEAQAARYDLSKSIDDVKWSPEGKRLEAFKDGRSVMSHTDVPADKLADYIGKEAADKLVNKPTKIEDLGKAKLHHLSGLDLKVGGEGMKGFYDQIIVKSVNKLAKEYGAQVKSGETKEGNEVHYIELPQKLKDAALHKGFPLFSSGYIYTPVGHNPFEEKKKKK